MNFSQVDSICGCFGSSSHRQTDPLNWRVTQIMAELDTASLGGYFNMVDYCLALVKRRNRRILTGEKVGEDFADT